MGQWRQANTGLQRDPRIATSVPIRIATVDPEIDPSTGKAFFRSAEETTANLSRGGAYLRSWEPLEAGRRVIVAIDLPNGEELQLSGRVVWTRRELRPNRSRDLEAPGYGIEFYGHSSRELRHLDQLLIKGLERTPSPTISAGASTTAPSSIKPTAPSRSSSPSVAAAPSVQAKQTSPTTPTSG
jgi:Tfp pilus assembly protein PilZ